MEGLKTFQLNTIVITLLYSTLLDNLPVKGSIHLDFLVFWQNLSKFQYFNNSIIIFRVIFGVSVQHQDTTKCG